MSRSTSHQQKAKICHAPKTSSSARNLISLIFALDLNLLHKLIVMEAEWEAQKKDVALLVNK